MTGPHDEEEPVRCTCGRVLTDDLSRSRKLGPRCWRKLHGRTARQRRTTTPASEAGPGQTELPLFDHQPTLWSA